MISDPMRRLPRIAWSGAILGAVAVSIAGTNGAVPADAPGTALTVLTALTADTVSFAADVLPIFQNRCAECHGGTDEDGEVRLEASLNLLEYDKAMVGSEFGTVIEAGDPEGSFLLEMIVEGDMPEEGDPVPEAEIEIIRAWIAAGAPNN